MAKQRNLEERRFFDQAYSRFQTRLKATVAEVRAGEPQDWSRVREQFLAYGLFLEQEPDAVEAGKW